MSILARARLFKKAVDAMLPPKGNVEDFHIEPLLPYNPHASSEKKLTREIENDYINKDKRPPIDTMRLIESRITDGSYNLLDLYSRLKGNKRQFIEAFLKHNPDVFDMLKLETQKRIEKIISENEIEEVEQDNSITNEEEINDFVKNINIENAEEQVKLIPKINNKELDKTIHCLVRDKLKELFKEVHGIDGRKAKIILQLITAQNLYIAKLGK